MKLDATDRKILELLQENGRMTNVELSRQVGISAPPCLRRVRALEENGYIDGYGARLSGEKLGYSMVFFVEVSLDSQTEAALAAFESAAIRRPEVLECHLMTGDADYMIKVAAQDTRDYESTYRKVIASLPHVSRIQSALVMKTVKPWLGYQVSGVS